MEIISFTGKSGTGKSYNAIRIAVERKIEAIIDDGLFIYKGQVIAGSSAKKCPTRAAAMRAALFDSEKHAESVKRAIARCKPERLMIIGTSDKMVNWIIKALDLHEPDERLYIEDFTTEEDRELAYHSRHDEGKHVIPAPMGELKHDFAGYFMNPRQFFQNLVGGNQGKEYNSSRDFTVVRPQFSYSGKFTISVQVIRDIVRINADDFKTFLSIVRINQHGGANKLNIDIDVKLLRNKRAIKACKKFQKRVFTEVESITSFSMNGVNIRIAKLCDDYTDLHRDRLGILR